MCELDWKLNDVVTNLKEPAMEEDWPSRDCLQSRPCKAVPDDNFYIFRVGILIGPSQHLFDTDEDRAERGGLHKGSITALETELPGQSDHQFVWCPSTTDAGCDIQISNTQVTNSQ